jgi:hypothetical protein
MYLTGNLWPISLFPDDWGEFVRRVEGRPPGKNAGPDVIPQTNTLHYQTPTNGEDVHVSGQDPVMNSIQNQGSYFRLSFIMMGLT